MRKIRSLTENLTVAKQAIAVWAVMLAEVLLFALLSTLLLTFGVAKEQSILISLIVIGLPTVIVQMILHGYVQLPAHDRPGLSLPLVLPLPSIYRLALSVTPYIIVILNLILILIIGSVFRTPHNSIYDK